MGEADGGDAVKIQHSGLGLVIAILGSLVLIFYTGLFPMNGDVMLALPIAHAVADPGLYAPEDLIVSNGIEGPYHLYKLASWFYRWDWNIDLIWQGLFFGFLVLYLWAIWHLAFEMTGNLSVAAIACTVLVIMSPIRGSLNWSFVPQQSFVTSLAAMPIGLFSIVFLYKKKFLAASLLGGLVFNVHPYVGLIVLACNVFVVLFHDSSMPFIRKVGVLSGGLLGLPNLWFLFNSMVLRSASGSSGQFYEQFRLLAWHAFIEDHWTEGYGWFALLLGLGVFFLPLLKEPVRKITGILIIGLMGIVAVYAINLYVFKIEFLLITYMFRATYFLKPLLIIVVVHGVMVWIREVRPEFEFNHKPIIQYKSFIVGLLIVLSFLAIIMPPVTMAEGFFLMLCGLVLFYSGDNRLKDRLMGLAFLVLGIGMISAFYDGRLFPNYDGSGPWYAVFTGVTVAAGLWMLTVYRKGLAFPIESGNDKDSTFRFSARICLFFVVGYIFFGALWNRNIKLLIPTGHGSLHERVFVSEAAPEVAGLTEWARSESPRGSLFVVPPGDPNFYNFRLSGERGVFITIHEVNQLLFDATIMDEVLSRLKALGVTLTSRHHYDLVGYEALNDVNLERLNEEWGADYFVAVRGSRTAEMSQFPVVWENEYYRVFELP